MKKVSKSIAALICGALIAGAGACSTGSGPMVVDGQQLRAGIYILKQQEAVNAAMNKIQEEQPDLDTTDENLDVFALNVEGKKFEDWVYEKTVQGCKEYVAVEKLFTANNLTIGADMESQLDSYITSIWAYSLGDKTYGETFEKLGISQQSYKDVQMNTQKEEALFDYLYGTNGPNAVPEDEVNAKLSETYAVINYMPFEVEKGTAQDYVDMIKNGKTFEEAYQAYYQEWYNEDSDKKREATGETDKIGQSSSTTVDLPEKDSLLQVITRTSSIPSEEAAAYIFDNLKAGDVSVVEVTEGEEKKTYVVQRVDISTKSELLSQYTDSALHEMKQDEFDNMLKTTADGYSVNEGSTRTDFKLEKMINEG